MDSVFGCFFCICVWWILYCIVLYCDGKLFYWSPRVRVTTKDFKLLIYNRVWQKTFLTNPWRSPEPLPTVEKERLTGTSNPPGFMHPFCLSSDWVEKSGDPLDLLKRKRNFVPPWITLFPNWVRGALSSTQAHNFGVPKMLRDAWVTW